MMAEILLKILFPLFCIIGIGVLLDRIFKLDLPTLSKLNFYVFVPALLLVKIADTDIPLAELLLIGRFNLYLIAALGILAFAVFSVRGFKDRRNILTMGTIFFNAGNYGVMLVVLAFGERFLSVIAVTLLVQNLVSFSLGLLLVQGGAARPAQLFKACLRVPAIHAGLVALLLRALNIDLRTAAPFLYSPLNYLAQGLIPIALLTLGVQMSRNWITRSLPAVSAVAVARLLLSPVLAAAIALAMRFPPQTVKVLIAIAGLPVAVNVYILSCEYRNQEELAAQMVFWTTLLSAFSLTGILLALQYWPG